jgi:S1-C subfamily serine protease
MINIFRAALTALACLAAAGNVVPSIENCVKMKTSGIASAGDFSNSKGKPARAKASAKSEDESAEAPSDSERLVKVSGTGFLISKNAHIVTNHHVVGDCVGDIQGNGRWLR